MRTLAPILVATLLSSAPVLAQVARWIPAEWNQGGVTVPPACEPSQALDFDPIRREFILCIPVDRSGITAQETWSFDGNVWTLRQLPNPTPRGYPAMVWDGASSRIILFGGYDPLVGGALSDTWAWDGQSWTRLSPTRSPGPRSAARMAYDSQRQRCVLFGGYDQINSTRLSDTWEWDGADWTRVATPTSPPGRDAHGMAYDAGRARTVIFGGFGGGMRNDTWEYDGNDWSQISTAFTPAARNRVQMVYSAWAGGVVLHSGGDICAHYNELLGFDGVNWSPVATTPAPIPAARQGGGLAVDAATGRILAAFGQLTRCPTRTYSNDGWWLVPIEPASYSTFGTSCPSGSGNPLLTNGSLPRLGLRMALEVVGLTPLRAGFLLTGFEDEFWGANRLPLDLTAFGAPGCNMYVDPLTAHVVPSDPTGRAQPNLLIPNDLGLLGAEFFNQFISLGDAPPGRALPITTTNAGRGVIGL
jgi:hypothetical protein